MSKYGVLSAIVVGILAIAACVFFFVRKADAPTVNESIDITSNAVEETITPEIPVE